MPRWHMLLNLSFHFIPTLVIPNSSMVEIKVNVLTKQRASCQYCHQWFKIFQYETGTKSSLDNTHTEYKDGSCPCFFSCLLKNTQLNHPDCKQRKNILTSCLIKMLFPFAQTPHVNMRACLSQNIEYQVSEVQYMQFTKCLFHFLTNANKNPGKKTHPGMP